MELGSILTVGALFGAGAIVILFVAGYLSAGTATSTGTISSGSGGANPSCDTLCGTWNSSRSAACAAIAISTAAASALVAANAALAGASTTALLLLAAATVVSLIPFIGPALAGPLFAAYIVAQAAVVFLLGRQVAAAMAASAAAVDVTTALARVSSTRADLMARCSDPAALARCLATSSPCAGVP